MNYPVRVFVLFTCMAVLGGCGAVSKSVGDYQPITSLDGLKQDQSKMPTLAYERPGAPDLSAYDRFIVGPVTVDYRDPDMKELSVEDVNRMRNYLESAIIRELTEAGYQVGTRSDSRTLRMSFAISGFSAPTGGGAANVAAGVAGAAVGVPMIAISVGEVTVEGTFRQALTNRVDAVVIDRSAGSRVMKSKPWSTWADVESAFDQWAEGIRETVDEAHGK